MSIAKTDQFNKNVVMVYSEENSFTGYKALEMANLDQKTSGIFDKINEINNKIQTTGDLYTGILVHQMDLNAGYDNVDIAGYAGADISGLNSAVSNNFPVYDSIEIKYDPSNNTTGVFYKTGSVIVREIKMTYAGSNLVGVFKTDY